MNDNEKITEVINETNTRIFAFTGLEAQQLLLGYMYTRNQQNPGQWIPVEDMKAFMDACQLAIVEAESIKMCAQGDLLPHWHRDSGFTFEISNQGEAKAIENEQKERKKQNEKNAVAAQKG